MRIGSHVSVAGGVANAPGNAAKVGCEVFQIFSRSPHGGPVKPITPEVSLEFSKEMKKHKLDTFYIHAPYYINLSSAKNNIYYGSISVLRQELERGSALGCKALMTHIGSFGKLTDKEGIEKVIGGIVKILDGYGGATQFLLEMSAGAGRIVGDTFEEIAAIIFDKRLIKLNIGVCFDTCHAFASGYDISSPEGVANTLKQFDKVIGFDKLVLMHINDSKGELGKHLDRHEHIGQGKIGLDGFKALAKHKVISKLDWILETPKDSPTDDPSNIAVLKSIRYT
ncbi:MAG: deoxyribonuclease IV [Candidatus Doudnabacteria bacterium]|nr:deoxyribonuclease IV [Candidatus Doudnabacteria bacterium]